MTEPDPRRAITEHRDNIRAEPRPSPVASLADVGSDDEELFRLYRWEWVVVSTVTAPVPRPFASLDAVLRTHFDDRYAGRIPLTDVRICHDGTGDEALATLQLRLPVLKGEFKHADQDGAKEYALKQGWHEFHVVTRNSKDDHHLRSYGTKKLSLA